MTRRTNRIPVFQLRESWSDPSVQRRRQKNFQERASRKNKTEK